MPHRLVVLATLLVTLALPATASAGSAIDTTGSLTNTGYDLATNSGPPFFDKLSSEVAQTFVAPAGAQAITKVSVLAAADANQPVWLKLYGLTAGAPDAELKNEGVSLAAGGRSLRSFDVNWPVVGGTGYAFAFGTLPADVTGNSSLTLPNNGGANGRNVYADGQVFGRPVLPPALQAWNPHADIDIKFRLDFDGGVSSTGGGGTTPTTPTGAPAPSGSTPTTPAGPTGPSLPAKALALKAAKGAPAFPASFVCTGATLATCSLTVTPPKGARSVRVEVLRGKAVVASGAVPKGKAVAGKRRTVRLTAKGALAAGPHTVRLTIVTAKGKTVRRTVTFTA